MNNRTNTTMQGIKALLNVFREGILNGSPDVKETASMALYELVDVTSPLALKPSVIQITGLYRVDSFRNSLI